MRKGDAQYRQGQLRRKNTVVGGLGDAPDNVAHRSTQCGNVVHNRSAYPIVDQRFTQKNLIHCLPLLWV
jgi:hypothetical protein